METLNEAGSNWQGKAHNHVLGLLDGSGHGQLARVTSTAWHSGCLGCTKTLDGTGAYWVRTGCVLGAYWVRTAKPGLRTYCVLRIGNP